MSRPDDNRVEDDPHASLRALVYVATELEARLTERDALIACQLRETMTRDYIRTLRRSLAAPLLVSKIPG